jgi:hypothetical protein
MPSNGITHAQGERFGRLVIVSKDSVRGADKQIRWIVQCDCGNTRSVLGHDLRTGHTTSCGCWRRDFSIVTKTTHGMTRTSTEYHVWQGFRARCLNPNSPAYARYGGRGITVCAEWATFEQFYADMGPRPSLGHSLDRIDNDGPYAPWNCRWATRTEQGRNTRANIRYTHAGMSLTLREWSEQTGISFNTLVYRIWRSGWSIERALTQPLHHAGQFRPTAM